jgi:hypothetical protein
LSRLDFFAELKRRERGEVRGAAEQVATGYAFAGDVEDALDWLEVAVDQEQKWYLRSPAFRALRSEPRFQALWETVGLPDAPSGCQGGSLEVSPPDSEASPSG